MIRRIDTISPPTSERAGTPKTPAQTPPPDDTQVPLHYDGDDAVIGIKELDVEGVYDLPLDTKSFRIGGSSQKQCEISLPGRGLSAQHAMLQRHGRRCLLHDLASTYGTIYSGHRIYEATDIQPGDTFTTVPVTFVALNREMLTHRPLLVDLLGQDSRPWSPDRLMIEAAKGLGNLLITGEAGCEHQRLASAVHAMSLLRGGPLVECMAIPSDRTAQMALLKSAHRSTIVFTITEETLPADDTFSSMLFSSDYHVRAIVVASSQTAARAVFPADNVNQMQHIWIRPIGVRAGELPGILDRLLSERDPSLRLASMVPSNRARLLAHDWRRNWEELRVAADRIAGIARIPHWGSLDWRKRSAALKVPKSTLHDWYRSFEFEDPLLSER
jgi:hypothetical protein